MKVCYLTLLYCKYQWKWHNQVLVGDGLRSTDYQRCRPSLSKKQQSLRVVSVKQKVCFSGPICYVWHKKHMIASDSASIQEQGCIQDPVISHILLYQSETASEAAPPNFCVKCGHGRSFDWFHWSHQTMMNILSAARKLHRKLLQWACTNHTL